MTYNDFASGQLDDQFRSINWYSEVASEYTPYQSGLLSPDQYSRIAASFPLFPFIVTTWQAQIGQNDSTVVLSLGKDLSDSYRRRRELIQNKTYEFIYGKLNYKKIELETIALIAREGNAVWMLNNEGQLIVESIHKFHLYWNHQNKVGRYAYKKEGVEVPGMQHLKHGVDLWHFRDPLFLDYPIAPSRLDCVYSSILQEHHAVKANTHMMSKGMVGTILIKLGEAGNKKMADQTKDQDGKTWLRRQMDALQDMFGGAKQAGKIGLIPDFESATELGKTNRDVQYVESLMEVTPTRLAWGFSMTPTDLGVGGATTYNNVGSFNQALYDRIGRALEQSLDQARNTWLLPLFGFNTSSTYYIKYNQPEDPNRLMELKQWLEDYKNGIITVNEYRDMRGLEAVPNGDVNFFQLVSNQQPEPQTIETEIIEKEKTVENSFFTKALVEFQKKTPATRAIESKQGEKLFSRWQNAIEKQIKSFLKDFKDVEAEVKLPKIESFYAFNVLKKDMLEFAGLSMDDLKKDKNLKFKAEFFDGKYPKKVIENIDRYVESLLKGDESEDYYFPSVDFETTKQIQTIIRTNASLGVAEIAKIIEQAIPDFGFNRAELIAHTSIADAVETTREVMYKDAFPEGKKSWQTAVNDVCPICKDNENEGKIGINQAHKSGHQSPSGHGRCRCTELYFPN